MTRTHIVLAHPDTGSFTHAWAEATRQAALDQGHDVTLTDLCASGFDPVLRDTDTPVTPDIAGEIERIRQADRIVFHFPLWWFAPPAIVKGWFDRVLTHPELHSSKRRFDTGPCRGKKALFCVTTGSTDAESAPDGKEGDVAMLLWPAAYALRYCGFTILKPVAVHDVHAARDGEENPKSRLAGVLRAQTDLIARFDDLPEIRFNADTDFDENGTLKPDRPSHSYFIRHTP